MKNTQVNDFVFEIVVVAFVLASNGFVHTNPNVRVFAPLIPRKKINSSRTDIKIRAACLLKP